MKKFTESLLRSFIRESLNDEMTPSEAMFYSILKNEAEGNGGWLRLTHETPVENLEKIKEEGLVQQPRSHGIYFTVGWYDSPVWITKGKGAMVRVEIPKRYIEPRFIVPDDRYGSPPDGYDEFMEENPDVVGGEVGTTFRSIPRGWIKEFVRG